MVMAAIRIKILHCAIAIACCRCCNCNRSIIITAPPSPPPLSRVVLSLPILFKYRHRSQRGRCTGGGADGLEDNKVSDDLYYFSIPPKININVLFSSSYIICPRPSQLYHFLESWIIFSLSLHQSGYSNITIIMHHHQHRRSSCHHPADDDNITISWPMTTSSSSHHHLAEDNFIIVAIILPSSCQRRRFLNTSVLIELW
jgi:hypothetical protein